MIESIAAGVVSNYLFTTLNNLAPDRLKKVCPAAFHGSSQLLTSLDKRLEVAKSKIIDKYPEYDTVRIFLDEKSLVKSMVLKPILDHFFQGKEVDRDRIRRNFISCLSIGEEIRDGYLSTINTRRRSEPRAQFSKEKKPRGTSIDHIIDYMIQQIKVAFF